LGSPFLSCPIHHSKAVIIPTRERKLMLENEASLEGEGILVVVNPEGAIEEATNGPQERVSHGIALGIDKKEIDNPWLLKEY
jgi:hypothetical protein